MITVVVTGSSGFVGRPLVAALKDSGYGVIEIDITTGFDLTLPDCLAHLPKFDWIIHLASRSFVPQSFKQPFSYYHDNFLSTLQVLETARRIRSKVIYFSSYLYGDPQYLPINEGHPVSPHNPYAQTKFLGEKLCEGYFRDFQVPITIFRPFNIYGFGQNMSFLIPKIIEQLSRGNVELQDSRPRRDYIHVLDVVNAVLKVIEKDLLGFEIFNIGSGKSISVKDLAEIISDLHPSKNKITFTNIIRQGEVQETIADISKAQRILNWSPNVIFVNGLNEIVKQYVTTK